MEGESWLEKVMSCIHEKREGKLGSGDMCVRVTSRLSAACTQRWQKHITHNELGWNIRAEDRLIEGSRRSGH